MEIKPLKLDGTYVLTAPRMTDERGYFMRSYDRADLAAAGLVTEWQQESLSFNREANTIRGLHFQTPPAAETKIVRVMAGSIWDVFVDLRRGSPTYGVWDAVELSEENGKAVYITAGFAHGFRTLEPRTVIEYKINVAYSAANAGGLPWNDPELRITWNVDDPIVSERDRAFAPFKDFVSPFEQK
jgi:dTDP-4-dehydrorhamnose 3,5-epimerase